MKRLFFALTLLFFAFLIAGTGFLYYVYLKAEEILTPDRIVQEIESNLNVRAELSSVEHDLFSPFLFIRLKGLRIGPRDHYAGEKIPLPDRPPPSYYFAAIPEVRLSIQTRALLLGKLEISEFALIGPELRVEILGGGKTSLDDAFRIPKDRGGSGSQTKNTGPSSPTSSGEEGIVSGNLQGFLRYLPEGHLRNIGLMDAKVEIRIRSSGYRILLHLVEAGIRELTLDPRNLKEKNGAHVVAGGRLLVLSRFGTENITAHFAMDDRISPLLDPETGKPNLTPTIRAVLLKGSRIQDLTITDYIMRKVSRLQETGLQGKKLIGPVTLTRSTSARIQFSLERVSLMDPLIMETDLFEIRLARGGWIRIDDEEHLFQGSVVLLPEDSKQFLSGVDLLLEPVRRAAPETTKRLRKELLGELVDRDRDRVRIRFRSTGNIESPDVTILSPLPSSERIADAIEKDPEIQKAKALARKILDEGKTQAEKTSREIAEKVEERIKEKVDRIPGKETADKLGKKAIHFLRSIPDPFSDESNDEANREQPAKEEGSSNPGRDAKESATP